MKQLTFVLVHGAWQGSWCFAPLASALTAAGHRALCLDLPGHGLQAALPASYHDADAASREERLSTEKSAVAAITVQQYVDEIRTALQQIRSTNGGPVILVGHSMGGIPVTLAVEDSPQLVDGVAYLAAFLPPPGTGGAAWSASEFNAGALISKVTKGLPPSIGALRIDHLSSDRSYLERVKQALAADVTATTWEAVRHLMTPDTPLGPLAAPLAYTAARWGTKPRLYVRCSEDHAVRPALQDHFITRADEMTSANTFEVFRLEASHFPFLSMPDAVAASLVSFGAQVAGQLD